MSKRIGKEKIIKQLGYLYFIGKDGKVWQAPMKRHKGKKKAIGKEAIKRKPGFMYYLDKAGYVAEVKMQRGG